MLAFVTLGQCGLSGEAEATGGKPASDCIALEDYEKLACSPMNNRQRLVVFLQREHGRPFNAGDEWSGAGHGR